MSHSAARPVAWAEGDDFFGAKIVAVRGDDLLTFLRDDRDDIPFPAHWDLPGGGREGAESAADCALRELEEEFGLRLPRSRLGRPLAFPGVLRPDRMAVFYTVALREKDIAEIRFGDEGQYWTLMPVADYVAHDRAVPWFGARVARCLGREKIS